MRIGLLSFYLSRGGGESRFATNLAKGLRREGLEVSVFSYACHDLVIDSLGQNKVDIHYLRKELSYLDQYRSISDSRYVFTKMLGLINKAERCDYYIVLSDTLIGISRFRTNEKWIYITNGDMILLYLSERFLKAHSPYSYFLSKNFARRSILHQKYVKDYDLLIGNSQFTSAIMSFLFESPIKGFVYPPVDTELFAPRFDSSKKDDEKYALVLLRNNSEPLAKYAEILSKKIKLKVVGKASIQNAITLKDISDEELAVAYSNAKFTITASFREFFGYATAESLACGTPVLSFAHGGASEMIQNDFNGWLVNSDDELYSKSLEIFRNGYDSIVRERARLTSQRFSIEESTKKLMKYLELD